MSLVAVPVRLRKANAFVAALHRTHKPAAGCLFCIGASDGEKLVGVVIVGRPTGRASDDGLTAEVVRCCTDGTKNACSFLYGAAWRAAKAIGYTRLITYTLEKEGGASLRGAGWSLVGQRGARSWSCPSRPRDDFVHTSEPKLLWATST